jgi:hypothetical protein
MIKPWGELRKVDVTLYTKSRKAKDDNGKTVEIPYLPWGKCVDLLHEHGAEKVWFKPLRNDDGSYLFSSREVETEAKNNMPSRKTGCYFVRVEITVDDEVWEYDYPLLNGANVVYDNTLNQRAINTAHSRAFVKGVALRLGLGWSLWSSEEDADEPTEDLSFHRLDLVQKRIEQRLTYLMQTRSIEEICVSLGWSRKTLDTVMTTYFRGISALEEGLNKL